MAGSVTPTTPFSTPASNSLQDILGSQQANVSGNIADIMNDTKSLQHRGGFQSLAQLGGAGLTAIPQGLATLQQILGQQGATDPRLFNQQIANNARQTQDMQTASAARFAGGPGALGAAGSGLQAALQAAIGAGGAGRDASIRANEAQMQEARKRGDLQSLLPMILNPLLGNLGQVQQIALDQHLGSKANKANMVAGLGSLAGNLASAGMGGGGAPTGTVN